MDALMKAPSSVSREDAIRRLKGALIGPDERQTCVVVTLTPEAIRDLRGAIGRGSEARFLRFERPPGVLWDKIRACHIDPDTVRVGGPPIDNVAIDEEGEKTLMRLAGLSMFLGLGLAWLSLRSVRLTGIVFACGVFSAMLAMAVVYYSGQKMDAILMSMPLLVYVLAMSAAVHLVSYYTSELTNGDLDNATTRAVRHAWKPALLCSVTTAIGLISLYASELAPIRKFGLFSAIGVIGLLAVTFIFLPAALQLLHRRPVGAALLAAEAIAIGSATSESRRRRRRNPPSSAAVVA
jgi:predicted RND superfamily exporter protein